MQEIKMEGLEQIARLARRLKNAPELIQEAKRRAFEEAAPEAKAIVDREIGGTGKVQSWQAPYVGSLGGYAAVRPKADTWTEPTKKEGNEYAVGAVTNAIVSGHRFPTPSGRKGYKYRGKSSRLSVPSKPFYEDAEPEVKELAVRTAKKVVAELVKEIGG